ncbi:MAG: alpha/beta fold hydrolase [Sphingorhabdus sp.]
MLASRQHEGSGGEIAESHWVDVAGGQLHVRAAGSGPLVILLHGWTLDWRIWLPQLALSNVRLVMPDRRGFGASTAPPMLSAERDDIDRIANFFDAKHFALIGLSQGAPVALDYARSRSDRLSAMSIIGAPLHAVVPEPSDAPEIDRAAYAELVRNGRFDDMMALWRRHPLTQVKAEAQTLVDDILKAYDGRDQRVEQEPLHFSAKDIAALAMPILAIAGAQDSVWRRQVADYIGANAPKGVREIIPHAGHLANVDAADIVNGLLQNFLNTHHLKEF